MKRTLALTVVTALCAVSPFVAGAAMSSLQQPGADANPNDGGQQPNDDGTVDADYDVK